MGLKAQMSHRTDEISGHPGEGEPQSQHGSLHKILRLGGALVMLQQMTRDDHPEVR
jgi:hypothetical protein